MADLPADLQKLVEEQAEARLKMDVQGYAKYLTPEAVDTLRASFSGIPPRVNRYDLDTTEEMGNEYIVDVRYYARDNPFIVRSRWAKKGDAWMVVYAERLYGAGDKRPGVFSKLVGSVLRKLSSLRR